jgi:calnexin
VRAQVPIECGGSYVKLLTDDAAFTPEALNDKTPYTIMFGPDKCGNVGKVGEGALEQAGEA